MLYAVVKNLGQVYTVFYKALSVAPGVYREYVDPVNSGREDARITYISEEKHGAVITGAEVAKGWTRYRDNVWVYRVNNSVFGNYNPYTTMVGGDWYFAPVVRHTGAVQKGKSIHS